MNATLQGLSDRLLAHAECHAQVVQQDEEQRQWAEDLRTAAAELKRRRQRGSLATPELLNLAQRVAALNGDAGEIGAGMLASLVDEARAAVASATQAAA